MKQLELGFYTRAEIAEILSVRLKGNNNFKRDVENKLSKWGYGHHYKNREGVDILSKPEAPEERLSEILYRGFGIDVQVHPIPFACFIAAFTDIENFSSMPWKKREKLFYNCYGYSVEERTMRNWCSQLIDCGVIAKVGYSTAWRTYIENGQKKREPVEEIDRVEMESYYFRRNELYNDKYSSKLKKYKMPPKKARNLAWEETYIQLWREYECCFYYCKHFKLSAFSYNGVDVREIYELARELAAVAPTQKKTRLPALTNQEEFVF